MSLTDALDRLAHESDQLKYHASQNTDQAGPFTSAYLYLEPGSNVLSLIRDAAPKEKRPFKHPILRPTSKPTLASTSDQVFSSRRKRC